MGSIFFLYRSAKSELSPQEDQGFVLAQATYAPDATLQQKVLYATQAYSILKAQEGQRAIFQIDSPGQSIAGVPLVPRDQRKFGATETQYPLQPKLHTLPAQRFGGFQQPSLRASRGH